MVEVLPLVIPAVAADGVAGIERLPFPPADVLRDVFALVLSELFVVDERFIAFVADGGEAGTVCPDADAPRW